MILKNYKILKKIYIKLLKFSVLEITAYSAVNILVILSNSSTIKFVRYCLSFKERSFQGIR